MMFAFGRRLPVRLFILFGAMMLALSGSTEQNLSARLEAPVLLSEMAPSEMFEGACQMPGVVQPPVTVPTAAWIPSVNVLGGDVPPVRYVMDPYPTFNGIAVDGENGKVLMSDSNRKGLLLYDRMTHSRSGEETPPEKQITGPNTLLGFLAGVAMDSERREVYGLNNDVEDNLSVFSYDDHGDLRSKRVLAVPHGAWGVTLNRARGEMAITVQYGRVVIYRMGAQGLEPPVRAIRGAGTGLADPHGVSWDHVNREIIVANQGNTTNVDSYSSEYSGQQNSRATAGQVRGRILPPSITVYPEMAEGDAKASRTIQGPRTQLAWPMGIEVDAEHSEIAVANNADNSVLIFRRTASGDAAPVRVIRGPRTGIDRPMGVSIDRKNDELWVANYGNHSAVVFGRTAAGNIAPKRVIRNAPAGTPTGGFGNPMALAFDLKREEILVPN
jgi:hypothetical protein